MTKNGSLRIYLEYFISTTLIVLGVISISELRERTLMGIGLIFVVLVSISIVTYTLSELLEDALNYDEAHFGNLHGKLRWLLIITSVFFGLFILFFVISLISNPASNIISGLRQMGEELIILAISSIFLTAILIYAYRNYWAPAKQFENIDFRYRPENLRLYSSEQKNYESEEEHDIFVYIGSKEGTLENIEFELITPDEVKWIYEGNSSKEPFRKKFDLKQGKVRRYYFGLEYTGDEDRIDDVELLVKKNGDWVKERVKVMMIGSGS